MVKKKYELNGKTITEYDNGITVEVDTIPAEDEKTELDIEKELASLLSSTTVRQMKQDADLEYIKCLQEISLGL